MPFSELFKAHPRSHLEGLLQVTTEVVWWDFVHKIGKGVCRTLPSHLVVAETPTERCRKSNCGGQVEFCRHAEPIDLIGLIVFDTNGMWTVA